MLHLWDPGSKIGPSLTPKSAFFYATPISPLFFGVRRIRSNGILSPPYPEVTLDNFSFPVGGRSAARRAVFRHRWPKMAIFGDSHLRRKSTSNFGPISMKLGPIVRFTKKWPWTSVGPVRVRITEKRPFVHWAEKGTNGQNSVFRYINTPKTVIPR